MTIPEIMYSLEREAEAARMERNAAARRLSALRSQIAALVALDVGGDEQRKGRAGGAARLVNETGNGCRISKSKVAPMRAERKRGLERRNDIEGRVRSLAQKFRVTPELEGGVR